MINYPVHYNKELGYIYDQKYYFICDASSKAHSHEIVKRINMHDELVKSLQDMVEIVGGNFCQNVGIKRKYKEARKLLEKCKLLSTTLIEQRNRKLNRLAMPLKPEFVRRCALLCLGCWW